ncbi:MAG: hypothetical protein GX547_16250 [Phycisphaerae bacterium]|nr:hypothetical protein [Phycisphaerae bacterium]
MTLIVRELPTSRACATHRDHSTQRRNWTIDGATDEAVVRALLLARAPATIQESTGRVLRLQGYKLDPQADDAWDCQAEYSSDVPAADWGDYQFATGGGTHHTTQSIQTRGRYPSDATDYKGAIGVTDSGVEGVDITSPIFTWSETYRVPGELVTDAYKAALFRLTGKVNQNPWRSFAAEEVLFQGARGATTAWDDRGVPIWEIAYEFAASENRDDLVVGEWSDILKHGWDYLWCKYDSENKPEAVYVEQVYHTADFANLGIE